MDLAPPVEDVDAFLHRDDRIAIEVGGALLKLGKILDCLQRALGAEKALHVYATQ